MTKKRFFTIIISLIIIINSIIFTNMIINDWKSKNISLFQKQLIVDKPQINTIALDAKAVATYAHKSAVIPESLILSKAKNVNPNSIFNHLNKMNDSGYDSFKTYENMIEYFIKKQTVALDDNSYQTIINHSVNNDDNDEIIKNLQTENKMLQQVSKYFNLTKNQLVKPSWTVTNNHINLVDAIITILRPDTTYLPLISYPPYLQELIKYLLTDWKLERQENYEELRKIQQQKGWSNTDIYLYDAGLNFNKALKKLCDNKDLGTLISENFIYDEKNDENKIDQVNLFKTITTGFKKLALDPETGLLLLKGLIPLIKSKITSIEDPTVGIKKLTWLNTNKIDELALKPMLDKIFALLQPENKPELQTLIVSLLKSPFAATIKIKTILTTPKNRWFSWLIPRIYELNDSIPELIKKIENASLGFSKEKNLLYGMKITNTLEKQIYGKLTDAIAGISTNTNFQKLKQQVTTYGASIPSDSVIDLVSLKHELERIFNADLKTAVTNFVQAYTNPNKSVSVAEIIKKIGLHLNTSGFLLNSPLANLQTLLKNEQTTISKVLNLINIVLDTKITNNNTILNKYYDNYISDEEVMSFEIEAPVAIIEAKANEASVIQLSYNLITSISNIKNNKISKITKYHVSFKNKNLIDQTFLLHRLQLLS